MAIGDILVPLIRERFPNKGFSEGGPEGALGTFPAINPAIGGITLYDDGDEITFYFDNMTHSHFEPMGGQSVAEIEAGIASEVVAFLERVFADEVVVWGTVQGSGGWYLRGETSASPRDIEGPMHVWSGPFRNDA